MIDERFFRAWSNRPPPSDIAQSTGFDPFRPDYLADPYREFDRLRREAPVFYSRKIGYWIVSRYSDVTAVLQDPDTFSPVIVRQPLAPLCPEAMRIATAHGLSLQRALVDEGTGTHARHRRIFGGGLSAGRIRRLEPVVRRIVDETIDRFIDDGVADLVEKLFLVVPARVVFALLGAPDDDALLGEWLGATRVIESWWNLDDTHEIEMMRSMAWRWTFARTQVDAALMNPGDDYLGDMARLHLTRPSLFTRSYLDNVIFLIQFAGHETTAQVLANGVKALLTHRPQWEQLCADPNVVPRAVEEILRFDTAVFAWRRIAARRTVIGGQSIAAADKILLLLGSANHDPSMFPGGERFDVDRAHTARHLSFGYGPHFCIGASLARLEIATVIEALTRRLPHMRLVEGQKWDYHPSLSFRVLRSLQVQWETRQQQAKGSACVRHANHESDTVPPPPLPG